MRKISILLVCLLIFLSLLVVSQQKKEKGSDPKHEPESPGTSEKTEGIDIGKQFLVLIAINNYNEWGSIKGPVEDAGRLKKILTTYYHFDVIEERYNEEATKESIFTLLRNLRKDGKNPLSSNDSLFIYYSGHGELDKDTNKGYWIPYDGGKDKISKSNWMDNSELTGLISNIESDHILIVSDSCFAGTLLPEFKGGSVSEAKETLKSIYPYRCRKVLTSGAREYVRSQSRFAELFIEALERYKDHLYVKVGSIFNSIEDEVVKRTGNRPLYDDLVGVGSSTNSRFVIFTKKGWEILVIPAHKANLFKKYLERAKDDYKNKNYESALTNIKKAKDIKITEELKVWEELIIKTKDLVAFNFGEIVKKIKNMLEKGGSLYNEGKHKEAEDVFKRALTLNTKEETALEYLEKIAEWKKIPVITPKTFIDFKKAHLSSPIFPELIEKLYKKYPRLPPEEYLEYLYEKSNQKGYWEAEINDHTMIYIPRTQDVKGGFFIDKFEVSFGQFEKVKKFKNYRKKAKIPLINKLIPNHAALVSFEEANDYCKENEFRLPTEQEWEFAAGIEKGYIYPWGNENVNRGGEYRANYDDSMNFRDGFETVAPVKSFEKYASRYGIVNMAGNVWEWIQGRKCKGGGFMSKEGRLRIKSFSRYEIRAGFRCVKGVKE